MSEREETTREELDGKGTYTVLYDGECPICLASVRRLRVWDEEGILSFLPAQDRRVSAEFSWIPPEALERSLHLVGPGGETWEGADAVERLVRVLPGLQWVAGLFRLPLARPLARWLYRRVARHRYRLRCGPHCGPGGEKSPSRPSPRPPAAS